jgi:hypothetical protein
MGADADGVGRGGAGVGAVNALSEVVVFVRDLRAWPKGYRCEAGGRIVLTRKGRPVHEAVYGPCVHAAAARGRAVLVAVVDRAGAVGRAGRVARTPEAA